MFLIKIEFFFKKSCQADFCEIFAFGLRHENFSVRRAYEEEKKSFFNKLRVELESDADRNRGPWTSPETWKSMKKNLTGHKVRMILGNPNMIKRDLNPRIDQVYHYLGDLDADGVDENAKVNFYRDRVVSFHSPFQK